LGRREGIACWAVAVIERRLEASGASDEGDEGDNVGRSGAGEERNG